VHKKSNGIGWAVKQMRAGDCVRRSVWNGKGMHLYLEDQLSHTIPGGVFKGKYREYDPVVVIVNAKGVHQPGWVCSQEDLLAMDWEVAV
jgi:hypothetical protein